MHPVIAHQVMLDHQARQREEAALRRRVAAVRPPRRWRTRPATWLLAAARRLDPGLDVRTSPVR